MPKDKIKMKLFILLFFLGQFGFCQTKIKLRSPTNDRTSYHFVNISDTLYIEMTHQEDMGAAYGQSYKLKLTAPDGKYKISVDNKIELRAFLKNHKKEGKWKTFYNNGKLHSVDEYKDGVRNGKLIDYYRTGQISYIGKSINGKAITGTKYYESGKVLAKNYFIDGEHVKQEVFFENGKLKYTSNPRTGTVTKHY